LLNVYSVLLVNPLRFPRVRAKEAGALAAFFQSEIAREAMREFGSAQFGRPLFRPLAAQLSSP
jgi:tungstate transport system substrate-binding protein